MTRRFHVCIEVEENFLGSTDMPCFEDVREKIASLWWDLPSTRLPEVGDPEVVITCQNGEVIADRMRVTIRDTTREVA